MRCATHIDVFPFDRVQQLLPFGFVYGWWQDLSTLTGSAVGSGMEMVGLW